MKCFKRKTKTRVAIVKHTVDLGKSPRLSSASDEVYKHEGVGIVEIELRPDDNLYVDGKKVELFLSEKQEGDNYIVGSELHKEIEGRDQILLNGNLLNYVYHNPELFPEHWKYDERGYPRFIYFWGSIFRNKQYDNKFVSCLFWDYKKLRRGSKWLYLNFCHENPSAIVAI